jgi:hypothetical protein
MCLCIVAYRFQSSAWCPKGHYLGRCTVYLGTTICSEIIDFCGPCVPRAQPAHKLLVIDGFEVCPTHIIYHTYWRPHRRYFCIKSCDVNYFLHSDWSVMVAAFSVAQLQFVRHYFSYNDSTDFYLHKLSTVEIADIIQCSKITILRLWKTWKKTKDVKRIYPMCH